MTLTRCVGATGFTASVAPAGAGLTTAACVTLIWAWVVLPKVASIATAMAMRVILICMGISSRLETRCS